MQMPRRTSNYHRIALSWRFPSNSGRENGAVYFSRIAARDCWSWARSSGRGRQRAKLRREVANLLLVAPAIGGPALPGLPKFFLLPVEGQLALDERGRLSLDLSLPRGGPLADAVA